MVMSEQDARTGENRIVLKPNGALSRVQARMLLVLLALMMGGIAAVFALSGAWVVLPFSGAEWLMIAYCLYLSLRDSSVREVITITESMVQIEKGRRAPEQTHRFQRAWVALELRKSQMRGHPSRLSFRLHGREVEIGKFLVESERQALASELKNVLGSR